MKCLKERCFDRICSNASCVEEMVVDYGSYGDEANEHICALLKELRTADKGTRL